MTIGVLKEAHDDNMVSLLPEHISTLVDLKVKVLIETDAGINSCFENAEYVEAGAEVGLKGAVLDRADLILKINPPSENELVKDKVYLGVYNPLINTDLVEAFINKNITAFSMDLIPRISRAQDMDILSSMATVAGYKAVLEAANKLPNFFPMFMSASGTIRPAQVLILGAGVAGLQALATARKLGAVVSVFDVRSAVKEQVESLGGKFIELEGATEDAVAGGYAVEQTKEYKQNQQALIQEQAIKSNVIICTAQIPGKPAPVLITRETIESMKPGSVIIDLAASSGGNTSLTKLNEVYVHNKVRIIGKSNYPSKMPYDASKMFGKNLLNFLKLIIDKDGNLNMNFDDEIVKSTCLTHNGKIVNERIKDII